MSFRCLSEKLVSKGLTAPKAVSLADLHRRREETQSQYFTPEWVSRGIWQSLSSIIDDSRKNNKVLSVVDTSCGNGRLFDGHPSSNACLHGLDTDSRCINALIKDAKTLDIEPVFETGCLSELKMDNFDLAVINPPFSIHLESPNLTHYDTNSFGRFGPGTSALSHEYALAQAIYGADVVAAILPVSAEALARSYKNLVAVVYLPDNTFIQEGANVKTAVYFYGPYRPGEVISYSVANTDEWPILPLSLQRYKGRTRFSLKSYDSATPTITLPVTGNPAVELHHHNRQIVLKFHCGLVQAKVLNALYKTKATGKRLPSTIKYSGQGCLLLDVLLLQDNPAIQLDLLADKLNSLGAHARVTPNLKNFYRKLVKRHIRACTPFYRQVKAPTAKTLTVRAKRRTLLNPTDFKSPTIKKDQFIKITPNGGEYVLSHKGYTVTLLRDQLLKRFEFVTKSDTEADKEWSTLHAGLNAEFPALAAMHKQLVKASKIDWLDDFQQFSLTEGLINPYGYIAAWQQGSGKARYAISLALLHPGKNLILVESGLLPEMLREFEKLGISKALWDVLSSGDTPNKKINLATYSTLRAGHNISYLKDVTVRGNKKTKRINKIVRTTAQDWKRQFNTVLCDEGGLLSNIHTQQTKAVKSLCARKLIVLDGTPQRNYPRDLLAISAASAGNGVSHQHYGVKGKAELDPRMMTTCNHIQRGEDAFYDNHVVTKWVTNEFKEDLQTGGKREVPKINNLSLFRDWLSPNIQRRLRIEPDLKDFNNCPAPVPSITTVDWDEKHLTHYLKTAVDFAHWYKQNKGNSKALNMVTVLARIQAVQRAASSPHVSGASSPSCYNPITSKQRFAIERLMHYVNQGKKVILYASSPEVLSRLHNELTKMGVKSVLFTGKQNIQKRALELDKEFRYGDSQILLSSWVGQRGLNLEQASAVIFYERNWSATNEEQAIYRTQRPSQRNQVDVEYIHLKGSIDEYCAQLVEWKLKASEAGLDFGDQMDDEEEFLHLDTILNRFCEDVLCMSAHKAKEALAS